ncbi:uncharacterized protein LOC141902102 [Tubulanus polymorphus]|uniref:uncharacterized protein LOC141902102 n=1 Tax=Tubulanus polymorphus TaxID=672921 RepID=UPI003DA2375A
MTTPSETARVYGPLGLITPVTILAKKLTQNLWKSGLDWDEPLSLELRDQWAVISRDLSISTSCFLPRAYFDFGIIGKKCELHVFGDASKSAYGAVGYLKVEGKTSFVISKNRVSPIKVRTIPEMELMAALLASRLATYIKESMDSRLHIDTHIWSDSQIVLSWINSDRQLSTFVKNRILEIRRLTSKCMSYWHYCNSESNPADLLSRGVFADTLTSCELWWKGPTWLSESRLPNFHFDTVHCANNSFVTVTATSVGSNTCYGIHKAMDIDSFNSLNDLLRVTFRVYRFVNMLLRKSFVPLSDPITVEEREFAENQWVFGIQSDMERDSCNKHDHCYGVG